MLGGNTGELHHIFGRVHLAIDGENLQHLVGSADFACLRIDPAREYHSFCDDFGPMDLYSVHKFCKQMDACIQKEIDMKIAVTGDCEDSAITNAVFLLGAYLIMTLDEDPKIVAGCFHSLRAHLLPFCDISPGGPNFELYLEDCWQALEKAKRLQWLKDFDDEAYAHFDSPYNADLHIIVPNKIIAMRGPKTLQDGALWYDNPQGSRDFSPAYVAEVLTNFDVKLVVRLNETNYATQDFAARGIAVVDLFFEDCTVPPSDVAVKFLLMVENLPGPAAVHCKAGLGRTGTLIALYLIKNFAFTARQAIGWMRIVRPGSIIGRQQQYLCDREQRIIRLRGHPMSGPYAAISTPPPSSAQCTNLPDVIKMVEGVLRRVKDGERLSAKKAAARLQRAEPGRGGSFTIGRPSQELDHSAPPKRSASSSDLAALDCMADLASHVTFASLRRGARRAAPRALGGPDVPEQAQQRRPSQ